MEPEEGQPWAKEEETVLLMRWEWAQEDAHFSAKLLLSHGWRGRLTVPVQHHHFSWLRSAQERCWWRFLVSSLV